jgi:outer membrane protein OmpA-like peptidoglycan-associated protein
MKLKQIFTLLIIVILSFPNISIGQNTFSFCSKPPIYKINGGTRNVYFFNKGKAKREAFLLEACRTLSDLKRALEVRKNNILASVEKNSSIDSVIINSIIESNKELELLTKEANLIDIKNSQDFEKLISVLQKLRDLKCKRIDVLTQFVTKKTNTLYSDIAFGVGSSVISKNGISELTNLVNKLTKEISDWKNYVSSCNENVFENDLFILVMDISGYADQQGSDTFNLTLSENRAKAVKLEIINQFNAIVKDRRVSLIFDKIQTKGYGEELPPGVTQSSQDDPKRRICIISSLVGPSSLLK